MAERSDARGGSRRRWKKPVDLTALTDEDHCTLATELPEARGDVDPRWPWTVTLTRLSGQMLNEQWSDVWRWILAWNAWAEANGCTLTVANRRVGGATRSIPTRVAIPDIASARCSPLPMEVAR